MHEAASNRHYIETTVTRAFREFYVKAEAMPDLRNDFFE
jgi:hypothetical protein